MEAGIPDGGAESLPTEACIPKEEDSTARDRTSNIHIADVERGGLEKAPTPHLRTGSRERTANVPAAQDWDGPDDPENPLNWPTWKKVYHTVFISFLAFAASIGSSIYTPGYVQVQQRFNVSTAAAFLPLSLYVLGLAFGPVLAAPISETYGRKVVYFATFPPSMLFTLGSGFAQNFATLLVCRFLAGTFSAPTLAVGPGSVSDMYAPINRAAASGVLIFAPFFGPSMGPVIGAYATQNLNWRWTQWSLLFIMLFGTLISLPQQESYKKIILQKRAKRLNLPPPTPPSSLPSSGLARFKVFLTITLIRPVHMLTTEPIVLAISTYSAVAFSILFSFFAAFPFVFNGIYHFNTGQVGLTFLPIGVGNLIGTVLFVLIDRLTYRKWTLAAMKTSPGNPQPLAPETRLHAATLGSVLLPPSLFLFAWTSRSDIHWIVPILSTIPFAAGNIMVFTSCVLYLIDVYGPLAGASAAAANGLMRYGFAAAFPLFTQQMYAALTAKWATSLLAFLTVALLPIPWVLMRWGPELRKRSRDALTK